MSQLVPPVTLAPLVPGPGTIDQKTITLYLQIAFGSGFYTVGGVPVGVAAYADQNGIDASEYLAGRVDSEATTTSAGASLPTVGGVTYKYIPATDKLQMFINGVEFTASEAIPAAVLNDTIVGQFTYLRLGH